MNNKQMKYEVTQEMNSDAFPDVLAARDLQFACRDSSPLEILKSGRIMVRALAENSAESDRLTLARTFAARLISAWWRALAPIEISSQDLRAPLQHFDTCELPAPAELLADILGKAAARLDAETAAHHIGLTYTCTLPRTHRAALGIYYTPPCLTAQLIARASSSGIDWATCRVLDPACGGGAFLAPIARRIIDELSDCSPRILVQSIASRLRGYEIDPLGAWLSQVALDAVLLPITRTTRQRLPSVVTVCDSLRECPPHRQFDLVIGNPPYGRIRLAPDDRARFKRSLFGHANLYGLFTDLALRHTRAGGVVAYVTPTSYLAGEYFKNLRSLLGREAPPTTFDFVSVRKGVFDSVLQETLLATYRRGAAPAPVMVHEIIPLNDSRLAIDNIGSFTLPTDLTKPWVLPRCAPQGPVVTSLSRMKHRLADWGYAVSTGPLVWNRYKNQLATKPGPHRHPLIWAEAVTSDGRFIWRAEKRGHMPWFEIRSGDDWLVTTGPCVLLQRTTAKEQSRRLIAAALPKNFLDTHGAVVIENHLNMIRPLAKDAAVSKAALAVFLNSAAADTAFRCVSGSVAVSAYELEALPLPDPEDLQPLERLVRGKAACARTEAECMRLYGWAS